MFDAPKGFSQNGRFYEIENPPKFNISWCPDTFGIMLIWGARTSLRDTAWLRVLCIGLKSPFFVHYSGTVTGEEIKTKGGQ
jgi:hypothetical protein